MPDAEAGNNSGDRSESRDSSLAAHPERVSPGTAGGSPASTHRWACGPLAGEPPAIPGTPAPPGAFPRERGRLARFNSPAGLPPTCGRDARAPRDTRSAQRFPRDRGRLARFNSPAGLRPGRVARAPRDNRSARRFPPGPRAARPLQLTGGPPAHLREGRPRSQEHPLRSALSPGPRAARPLQLTGGPPAHLRASRPRSQEPLRSAPFPGTAGGSPASTHRRASGPLAGGSPALPGTPAPLSAFPGTAGVLPASTHRWACGPLAGEPPALPGTPPLGAFPRDRGRLARFNSPAGLRPAAGGTPALPGTPAPHSAFPGNAGGSPASTHRWACGPLAGEPPALPGTPPLGAFPRERGRLARFNSPAGLRPAAGGTPALPGTPAPHSAFPGNAGGSPASTHRWACGPPRAGRPRSRGHPLRPVNDPWSCP